MQQQYLVHVLEGVDIGRVSTDGYYTAPMQQPIALAHYSSNDF